MTNLKLSTERTVDDQGKSLRMTWRTWSHGVSVHYDDVALMQYYLDRATVLVKVREELGL